MFQILGDFNDEPNPREYVTFGFSPCSTLLEQRWRNNGLSADFLADYSMTFFPGNDTIMLNKQTGVRSAISYVANELIENAMKHCDQTLDYNITIHFYLHSDCLVFQVTNTVPSQRIEKFQKSIQELIDTDLQLLYLRRLKENAKKVKTGALADSRLGLLTILRDYPAKLGWKFEIDPQNQEVTIVTTNARLAI